MDIRIDDARDSLLKTRWDLVIVDEAHKMSAASEDNKTMSYQMGEKLSERADHYLLMTATPHKGDPENFRLFLSLLDKEVYGNIKSLENAMASREAPFYLRRVKEALVTFPDPDTGKSTSLFKKRLVIPFLLRSTMKSMISTLTSQNMWSVNQSGRQETIPCVGGRSALSWQCSSGVLLPVFMQSVVPLKG